MHGFYRGGGRQGRLGKPLHHDASLTHSEGERVRRESGSVPDCHPIEGSFIKAGWEQG